MPRGRRRQRFRYEDSRGRSIYRHLCVFVADSLKASMEHFVDPPGCMDDCPRFTDRAIDTVDIGGRRATIEKARVSGGVQGADQVPWLLVAMPIGDGKTVILDGNPGDAAGYRELIAIARTMRTR